jgi:flagellum-specific peptidoglycan hydrolase FlgJ
MKKLLLLLTLFSLSFITIEKTKTQKVNDYIEKFKKVAKQEEKLYGIPAYLTLAQGIHESDCATSVLYKKTNNHFGIKDGYLANGYVWHKDGNGIAKFAKYDSDWASFRSHSIFLNKYNYAVLKTIKRSDYKLMCNTLKICREID